MTYLPPPQPILNKDIRISGDVEIHPTASLAPGVILQAASDSRITVGADVCIGMGVIINACKGSVEIGDGAILGTGVLIIGESKIGSNCCVGTSTTILCQNIAPMTVIDPGSIVGDTSRSIPPEKPENKSVNNYQPAQSDNINQSSNGFINSDYKTSESKPDENSASVPHQVETEVDYSTQKSKVPVVGQVYINELLITLFPHRKDLDSSS